MSKEGEPVVVGKTPVDTDVIKEQIKTEVTKPDNAEKFIPLKGELIEDKTTSQKYATITVNQKIMKYIVEGLAKYQGAIDPNLDPEEAIELERVTKLIDEFMEVNDILLGETVIKTFGSQEPNGFVNTNNPPEPNPESI